MKLDEGPRPLVAGFPRPQGGIPYFPGLIEELFDLLFITQNQLADRLAHLGLLSRIAPECVFQEKEVVFRDFALPRKIGVGLEQREGLPVAPVRGVDIFFLQRAPNVGDGAVDRTRDDSAFGLFLHLVQLGQADGGPLHLRRRFEHSEKAEILLDVFHDEAEEKAVIEGHELVVLWQLVAGSE